MSHSIFTNKKAIIFDFDGTIADTFKLHEAAFQKTLKPYQLQFAYKDYLGMSTNEAIKKIFSANNIRIEEEELVSLVKTKRLFANQSYQNELKFIEGASDFIQLAHQYPYKLYVASSGSRMNVTAGLTALGIKQYFTDVITADDIKNAKPHPEIFEKVLNKHAIDAAEAMVIEDAVSGIEAALAAKIDVVCVEAELKDSIYFPDSVKFLSFTQLIFELQSFIQYEKSISSHRNV